MGFIQVAISAPSSPSLSPLHCAGGSIVSIMRRRKTSASSSSSSSSSSSMHSILIPLLVTLSGLVTVGATAWNSTGGSISSLKLERIHRHLETINKPPVRAIQSPDGDIIDCVHKHKQLALDHPLLKNHKIQGVRPKRPELKNGLRLRNYTMGSPRRAWQTWHHVGHCPKGTVPVRRSSVDDVLRARSLYHFGKKHHHRKGSDGRPIAIRLGAPDVVTGNGHEHAIAYTGASDEVYGARATINVWQPSIEAEKEFSLSQIWVLSGSFDGSDLNSIEAGWQVSPELYGDSRPRLFTYWTSDAYRTSGCYNLLCSGFIQTNNKIAIGAAISPVSSLSGDQFDITILIWKDPRRGNWWMSFGNGALIGYWPTELFTHLANHATMVEWGGEVVNIRPNGVHTSTQMGSGRFAEDGFAHASYFRNLELVDSDNSLSSVESISTLAENTDCYDIRSSANADWGTYFYFGGPGNNPKCP